MKFTFTHIMYCSALLRVKLALTMAASLTFIAFSLSGNQVNSMMSGIQSVTFPIHTLCANHILTICELCWTKADGESAWLKSLSISLHVNFNACNAWPMTYIWLIRFSPIVLLLWFFPEPYNPEAPRMWTGPPPHGGYNMPPRIPSLPPRPDYQMMGMRPNMRPPHGGMMGPRGGPRGAYRPRGSSQVSAALDSLAVCDRLTACG